MAQTGLGTPPPNHLGNGNLGWSYHGACLNVKKQLVFSNNISYQIGKSEVGHYPIKNDPRHCHKVRVNQLTALSLSLCLFKSAPVGFGSAGEQDGGYCCLLFGRLSIGPPRAD